MTFIKTQFSSADLENISGIKAHTIRIWEKRYDLLSPKKAARNIRLYDMYNMQKLLNVALLNKYGYKISKIAAMGDEEIFSTARDLVDKNAENDKVLTDFKLAMYSFDQYMFQEVYERLLEKRTFSQIFVETFIPLLDFIGLLWQTDSIQPVHEHFISNLILQKIHLNTVQLKTPERDAKVFVLFLPENEVHELGLLFMNYELQKRGFRTVYLGRSIPIENIKDMFETFSEITFVSHFTMVMEESMLLNYFKNFERLLKNEKHRFWGVSHQMNAIDMVPFDKIAIFASVKDVILKEI